MNWSPLILTFELAGVTTVALLVVSVPLAWWLSATRSRFKPLIETLVSMPIVLPPTVIGFYFLLAFSPGNAFGTWLDTWLGIQLVFSFEGLVVASMLYSLPFMVHPIQAGLSSLPHSLKEAAYVMGKSPRATFWYVLLPNVRKPILTGVILSFAHVVGEFGVVLMIGGNIPGQTKVASIAIYDRVEALDYAQANFYSMVLFAITFAILFLVNATNGGFINKWWR